MRIFFGLFINSLMKLIFFFSNEGKVFCVSHEGCGCSYPNDRGHDLTLKNNHCLLGDPEAICTPAHSSTPPPLA